MVIPFIVDGNGSDFGKVILSNRLVKSPCAVIADTIGYTANIAKLMGEFPYAIESLPLENEHSRL
jgi:hypothetical protein